MRGRLAGCRLSAVAGGFASFLVAALLVAAPAGAQQGTGYRFVGGVAYEQGSPGPLLASGLDAIGFGDTQPGPCGTGCTGTVEFPSYLDGGLNLSFLLGFRYRPDAPASLEVLFSNGARGSARGYDRGSNTHVTVSYTSLLATPTVGGYLGPVRLHAGPVLNGTRWEAVSDGTRTGVKNIVSLGWTAGASVEATLGETLLSLTGGARSFPPIGLDSAIGLDLVADYRTFFIGVTVAPL